MIRATIIIPCYNRANLLGETLDSLRSQTFPQWEAIVVDDGSRDNSLDVAQRYARSDGRIHAVPRQGSRKGGNVCRNQGLSLAQGDYIIFLDSDDLLSQTCLEHRVAAMDSAPDCGFGVYQTELFTQSTGDRQVLWNAYTEENDLHRFLSLDTVWLTTGPIWRKQALTGLGGFDESILSFQDWAIHVQALIGGIRYFKEPIRDNFHRFEYDGTNTIYAVAGSHPDHLESHEKLFEKTFHSIKAAGLINRETRCRMAGIFWWLATRWEMRMNIKAADQVWRKAANLGLCAAREYIEGRLIFRLHSIRGGGRIARLIQRAFWPPQYTRLFSEHLYRAPVRHMDRSPRADSKPLSHLKASKADP